LDGTDDARVRALEDEVRARDELLAMLAHELRNPIAPVLLEARLLRSMVRKAPPDGALPAKVLLPRCESFVAQVELFLTKLDRLTDAAQGEDCLLALSLEEVDLCEVVRHVAAGVERERAATGSPLTLELPGPVVGRWDPLRLEQVVGNLLGNALRYGDGAPIAIAVEADAEDAVLTVRDEGIGIPVEEQRRVFERFTRVGGRRAGGLGIGLWIVRAVCEAHGGTVSVDSRPGAGARFTVRLPRSQETKR
jgi:signal transduction histidine kinase